MPDARFKDMLGRGLLSTRPVAGIPGRRFLSTDGAGESYDDGSAWQTVKGSLLAIVQYNPATTVNFSITSTTLVDLDATNLAIAVLAPDSGRVLLRLTAEVQTQGDSQYAIGQWGLREGSSIVAGPGMIIRDVFGGSTAFITRVSYAVLLTGLTAGSAHTYKWAGAVTAGTLRTSMGQTGGGTAPGEGIMEAWAA